MWNLDTDDGAPKLGCLMCRLVSDANNTSLCCCMSSMTSWSSLTPHSCFPTSKSWEDVSQVPLAIVASSAATRYCYYGHGYCRSIYLKLLVAVSISFSVSSARFRFLGQATDFQAKREAAIAADEAATDKKRTLSAFPFRTRF